MYIAIAITKTTFSVRPVIIGPERDAVLQDSEEKLLLNGIQWDAIATFDLNAPDVDIQMQSWMIKNKVPYNQIRRIAVEMLEHIQRVLQASLNNSNDTNFRSEDDGV